MKKIIFILFTCLQVYASVYELDKSNTSVTINNIEIKDFDAMIYYDKSFKILNFSINNNKHIIGFVLNKYEKEQSIISIYENEKITTNIANINNKLINESLEFTINFTYEKQNIIINAKALKKSNKN